MIEKPFSEPHRKLAAILAADMVGFSRMMGVDEEGTLARLHAARQDVIDPILTAHHGRIFKVLGDGILVEFHSVVMALRAAVAVQAGLRDHNAGMAPHQSVVLRIGVHQGDVVVHGTDLLGDGVNVAARLEPLAPPGGICISARVREDAAGKLPYEIKDGGARLLKNIARPMQVFFVQNRATTDAVTVTPGTKLTDSPFLAQPAHFSAEETMVSAATSSTYSLVVVETATNGPPVGEIVSLAKLPLIIGRQMPSDVILPSSEVSRCHCRIERVGQATIITDYGSTNGTFVDGRRIEAVTALRPGSLVRVGPYVMRYAAMVARPPASADVDATSVSWSVEEGAVG